MPQANAAAAQGDQQRTALPLQQRDATVKPATFNAERNTVQVCWTQGARVRRYDWWNERFYEEELVVTPEAVDMSRFNAGAIQVLDGHRSYGGVSAILGIADRGWIAGGEGLADIRLSNRPELTGIVGDIRDGIIRDISFGYSVERYEIVRAQDRVDGVNLDLWRAVRWTPQEISFVPVPADAGAGTRSATGGGPGQVGAAPAGADPRAATAQFSSQYPCEFIRATSPAHPPQEHSMPQGIQPGGATATPVPQDPTRAAPAAPSTPAAPAAPAAPAQGDAAAAELQRSADITDVCVRHGVAHLASAMIRAGNTVDQANAAVLAEIGRRDAAAGGHHNTRVETVSDEVENRQRGIEEALAHRCNPRAEITDLGRQFRGMSLLEIGRDYLESRGVRTRGWDRLQLATTMLRYQGGMAQQRDAAFHSTSDFANILGNVATKRLRMGYEENPGTYSRWARRAPNLPDFKQVTVAQLGAMPDLLAVNEAGEIKYGTFGDAGETYNLLTFARIVSLTRQAVINDDLRAFDRIVTGFGAAAARLENRTVYAQLTANAALADSVALFHATHANNGTGGGSALQFSALVTGRAAMRVQKGLSSEELNIAPAYLIGPAALEQTMYQLTSSNYVPATKAEVNEFRSGGRTSLEPIVEPILDGTSAATWYLAASNSQVDTVEYAYLDGAEGPVIESEVGFEVDGISFKCREDFAAKVLDYRGLYRGVGS